MRRVRENFIIQLYIACREFVLKHAQCVGYVFWMFSSHRTYISFTTVLQDKCQSGLTGGTMWGSALAMAPVIIHISKGPDGEVKVSVKILFLERGVLIPSCAFTFVLSQSLCLCFSQSVSLALFSSNPCSAVFYQILSRGASYKTNRAHQDWAPEDQFGQSTAARGVLKPCLVCIKHIRFGVLIFGASTTFHWEWFMMKTMVKGTWAAVLNQQSYPETLDKHTVPGFLSGLVGLWGRKVCA